MSKVICDICGTTYQDTADVCPICGCARDIGAKLSDEELLGEDYYQASKGKGGRFSNKKKKEIFDFDRANPDDEDEEPEPIEAYAVADELTAERPRHNVFLVVLLTIVITVLVVATGYLFGRYYLPNILGVQETTAATEEQTLPAQTESTEVRIPCQNIVLTDANAELTHEGNYFLLNVVVKPENTTDQLTFASADESIATVTENGRITAVSQGETVIYVTCGDKQLTCKVTCNFEEATQPETEAEQASEETTGETVQETTPQTTLADVELRLEKTDVRLMVGYSFTLGLDCELDPEDVEWSVEHDYICKVDNGYVTALKSGNTDVIVKYGDQEARCIVRCYQ